VQNNSKDMFLGVILWIGLCFLVAKIGANRNIGYWGAFFLSLLLSPLIGIIFVFLSDEIKNEYRCKYCGFTSSVNSDFCPACGKDSTGKDKDAYKKISKSNEDMDFFPPSILEDKSLISSHLIKIFVLFSRLQNCTFPRGIWNSYLQIQRHIADLKRYSNNADFDKDFAECVTQQILPIKSESNAFLIDKLVQEPTITTIERETRYFLDKNIPAYIEDGKKYIIEEVMIKSRKATKLKMLMSEISNCNELSSVCNESNAKLLEAQIQWLSSQKNELEG
jgi:hypothetical protein